VNAAARLKDLLMRMKRGRGSAEVPKRDVLDAYGISEEDLMGRRGYEEGPGPRELGSHMSRSELGRFLQAENIGVRMSPRGAKAYDSRAHFDAVGGSQLPHLAPSGLWDEVGDELKLGQFRFLSMDDFPRAKVGFSAQDEFAQGLEEDELRRRIKPYGMYVNEYEGDAGSNTVEDFVPLLRSLQARRLTPQSAAAQLSKLDTVVGRTRLHGPGGLLDGLSFQDLLDNSDLRSALNASGYLPRSSPLYKKPLVLAKKQGGRV
jgi:hypothetical protein